MKPIISAKGIGKRYLIGKERERYLSLRDRISQVGKNLFPGKQEAFWALKDVDFDIMAGECIGIIGRNGAGKSTLLKILSRITPPTTGRITMRGRVASLLEVGTGFHPELTGRENIFLNGSILGMKRGEILRQFDEMVEFSGVSAFLDTPLKHYSSGMQLRLAFSVAAHLNPEILLIDEVLAVGDVAFQKKCLGKMDEVSKSGRTVVFVSHDLGAIRRLCPKGLLLSGGKVAHWGDMPHVLAAYLKEMEEVALPGTSSIPISDALGIYEIQLVRNGGIISGAFQYGDELGIRILFHNPGRVKHFSLGYVLSSMDNTPILNANTHYLEMDIPSPGPYGEIWCDLGNAPLIEGLYNLSFWFGETQQTETVLRDAISFKMSPKGIFKKGFLPPRASKMYWPTEFSASMSEHPYPLDIA